jgi:hypoxanthine phosphoribosyltransferase
MKLNKKPMFTSDQIQAQIDDMAEAINRHYGGKDLTVLIVLKGGLHFGSDLLRRLNGNVTVDFLRARSYEGEMSAGIVEVLIHPTEPLKGRHVLIVEDILDTGLTARALLDLVKKQQPASTAFCALFDKPSRREVRLDADFTGFTIDDHFLVGYGMDLDERYREFPDVYVMD